MNQLSFIRKISQYACILAALTGAEGVVAQSRSTAQDGEWAKKLEVRRNTPQADLMVRVGDIDNLNFGFPEDYTPFSGRSTDSHGYPWTPDAADPAGTDRIQVVSGYTGEKVPCSEDGYTASTSRRDNRPRPIEIPLNAIGDLAVRSASVQIFIDDFQSKTFCSRYRVWLNGTRRYTELEALLREIDQTGPVGKLLTVPLPESLLPLLKSQKLSLLIDDSLSRAGDGFAIDFVKLLVNPRPEAFRGNLVGKVLSRQDESAVAGALVEVINGVSVKTKADGTFQLNDLAAGLAVLKASARGYRSARTTADVYAGETNSEEVIIYLDPPVLVTINGKDITEGDNLILNTIQFQQGSAVLLPEGKAELDKLVGIMNDNPELEIELSGHTSDEGELAKNVLLSQQRAEACRAYLARKGIVEDRIRAMGYGPNRPLVANDTPTGRAQNRRVELRVTRI